MGIIILQRFFSHKFHNYHLSFILAGSNILNKLIIKLVKKTSKDGSMIVEGLSMI